MARQHFLFHTPDDLVCFCHLYPHWKARPGQNVFTALGLSPAQAKLGYLRERFPNARLVGVFDNDIFGNVLDCKIMLWQRSQDIKFTLNQNYILFNYRGKDYKISITKFSVHRFKTLTGIRSTYRTIKPKKFISFISMVSQTMPER
ncbi:hypothetical protein [Sphingobacterium siyangense]|uniref:hypothetical protein n=1 Tax=Sphingobacterium siyangense TaxID=459529 RepID=UPI003C7135F8